MSAVDRAIIYQASVDIAKLRVQLSAALNVVEEARGVVDYCAKNEFSTHLDGGMCLLRLGESIAAFDATQKE